MNSRVQAQGAKADSGRGGDSARGAAALPAEGAAASGLFELIDGAGGGIAAACDHGRRWEGRTAAGLGLLDSPPPPPPPPPDELSLRRCNSRVCTSAGMPGLSRSAAIRAGSAEPVTSGRRPARRSSAAAEADDTRPSTAPSNTERCRGRCKRSLSFLFLLCWLPAISRARRARNALGGARHPTLIVGEPLSHLPWSLPHSLRHVEKGRPPLLCERCSYRLIPPRFRFRHEINFSAALTTRSSRLPENFSRNVRAQALGFRVSPPTSERRSYDEARLLRYVGLKVLTGVALASTVHQPRAARGRLARQARARRMLRWLRADGRHNSG